MAITPQTNVRLIKCPLELDYKNQLTFSTKQAQETYFKSLPYLEIDECSYQRKDNIIRWPAHIDSLMEYNYVMYQNENYGNKYFYAFILNMQYYNDGCTYISIATDVFQTWQFDITWKKSFVEREMINVGDDTPGANLIQEDLETGDYIENASTSVDGMNQVYVIAYSRDPVADGYTSGSQIYNGCIINNIANGLWYCICSAGDLLGLLKGITIDAHDTSVIDVFTIPALAVYGLPNVSIESLNNIQSSFQSWITGLFNSPGKELSLSGVHSSLNGYTPRNQKLKTYPFTYLGFNPSNGTSKVFRYEDFSGTPSFSVRSEVTPSPSVLFVPKNYKGSTGTNVAESCSAGGYPTISWHNEAFNSWLAQNQNMINLDIQERNYNDTIAAVKKGIDLAGDMATTTWGAMSGEGGGVGLTGIAKDGLDLVSIGVNNEFYIQKQMAQVEAQKLLPNKGVIGSGNGTLLGYSLFNNDIFKNYSIKYQFAERIDLYFDMYGYKTNMVKIPNTNNRPKWNYVKTIGSNIIADIPQKDLDLIKKMFDMGVTLWHDSAHFLDYSQNNRT